MLDKIMMALGSGFVLFILFAIVCWCMNIYYILGIDNILDTAKGILMVVGIFAAPLGSVMGLINFLN
jgi:hypothetical protein